MKTKQTLIRLLISYFFYLMEDIKNQKQGFGQLQYIKETLLFGSFILHSNVDQKEKRFIFCDCNKKCRYKLLNNTFSIPQERDFEIFQAFEESKNNGYPAMMIKPITRSDMSVIDYMIELYSLYNHMEIDHNIVAELTFPRKKLKNLEDEVYQDYEKQTIIVEYEEQVTSLRFFIAFKTNLGIKVHKFSIEKTGQLSSLPQNKDQFFVSENQLIVIFFWLLKQKDILNPKKTINFLKLINKLKENKQALQSKLESIRKKSYTRLYDLSLFYTNFQM